jgi:hypothetical protein
MQALRSRLHGEIAQLVEHTTENRGVPGSSPGLAIPESSCISCGAGGPTVTRRGGRQAARADEAAAHSRGATPRRAAGSAGDASVPGGLRPAALARFPRARSRRVRSGGPPGGWNEPPRWLSQAVPRSAAQPARRLTNAAATTSRPRCDRVLRTGPVSSGAPEAVAVQGGAPRAVRGPARRVQRPARGRCCRATRAAATRGRRLSSGGPVARRRGAWFAAAYVEVRGV